MKDTPTVKKEVTEKPVVNSELQREIYLRLLSATAADGKFDLGDLASASAVIKTAGHLKGVSEILAVCFEGKLPAPTE
jgi:hypothetical protein